MRSRSAAARAPKTDEAALALAQRRAELDASIGAREAERTAAIAPGGLHAVGQGCQISKIFQWITWRYQHP